MIYTGIGARKTPGNILHSMVQVGEFMYNAGHILRSGGAQGADRAFEIGADRAYGLKRNARHGDVDAIRIPERKEIYTTDDVNEEAMLVAGLFHPAWTRLKPYVRMLMARNAFQVLGQDLKTPSDFVICWTPDGEVVGGTGQALRMAAYYDIPVINFGNLSLEQVNECLQQLLEEPT